MSPTARSRAADGAEQRPGWGFDAPASPAGTVSRHQDTKRGHLRAFPTHFVPRTPGDASQGGLGRWRYRASPKTPAASAGTAADRFVRRQHPTPNSIVVAKAARIAQVVQRHLNVATAAQSAALKPLVTGKEEHQAVRTSLLLYGQ